MRRELITGRYIQADEIPVDVQMHEGRGRAHSRRQFFEAVQSNPQDPVARAIVARMDELFAIDAEACHEGIDLAGRHALRQEKAKPLLDVIRKQIEPARSNALPASPLAQASQYTLTSLPNSPAPS